MKLICMSFDGAYQTERPSFPTIEDAWEHSNNSAKTRLEYLRKQIVNECISLNEIHELQSLKDHIEPGDVQLLEWAGVPEFPEDN